MLQALNHIRFTVSDVSRSFDFYVNTLGFIHKAKWDLPVGDLWLVLSADLVAGREDYTH
jgi:glutathione S-transferase